MTGALLVSATACGGGPSAKPAGVGDRPAAASSADTRSLDPCTILPAVRLGALVDATLTQHGPAQDRALGRECTWDFPDRAGLGTGTGTGTLSITAWHGREFFAPGSISRRVSGLGDEAQADPTLGIVLFRVGDQVVQAHVLSPDKRHRAPEIARALAAAI
jgi:hypothetical protein